MNRIVRGTCAIIATLGFAFAFAGAVRAATITLQNEILTDPSQATTATTATDTDITGALLTPGPSDYPIRILSIEIMTKNTSGNPASRDFDIQMFNHRPLSHFSEPSRRSDPDWTIDDIEFQANMFSSVDVSDLGIVIHCGSIAIGVRPSSVGGPSDPKLVCDLTGCNNDENIFWDDSGNDQWDGPCPQGVPGSFAIRAVVETNVSLPPATGMAKSRVRIDSLPGTLGQFFGIAAKGIGDLDNDGLEEVAVGASGDTEGGSNGAVWILFLNSNGTVRDQQKINNVHGGLTNLPSNGARFGDSVGKLGDVDGDGIPDIAVGAPQDDGTTPPDPQYNYGAVWILFLNSDGTVKSEIKLDETNVNFLTLSCKFGSAVEGVGDLDGNGVPDLAVGASGWGPNPPFFNIDHGSVHIFLLDSNGDRLSHRWIRSNLTGFNYTLEQFDLFGAALARVPDVNGDGRDDLWVGAPFVNDYQTSSGAAFILRLSDAGFVSSYTRHEAGLRYDDLGGQDLAVIPNLDGSNGHALAVTSENDPCIADPSNGDGDSIILRMQNSSQAPISTHLLNSVSGGLSLPPGEQPNFTSIGCIGDLNGDGIPDIVVGQSILQAIDIIFLDRCSPVNVTDFNPTSGISLGGDTVTITGSGFTSIPDTTVIFGNAAGTVTSVTATEIEVAIPGQLSGVNRVDIIVTNSNGSCRMAEGFTYLPCPSTTISAVVPSSGFEPGLESVTINGSNLNLGGNTQVFFDGNPATVVNATASSITVTTPPGTGTVDVQVTNNCGSGTRVNGYSYNPCNPTVTSFTPSGGREPGGITVTLTGTNFTYGGGTPSVTFGGVPASVVSFTATSIEVLSPPGTGNAILEVTTSCGSVSPVARFNYSPCNPTSVTTIEPDTGAESGDTQLHIRGSGFVQDEVREVLFGGVAATIVRRTSGRIVVRTPPGTGTVDISIRNDCETLVVPASYTYFPDEIAARFGSVNVDDGDRADVLFINGSAGDANRVEQVNLLDPFNLTITAAPSRVNSTYAVWAFVGEPTSGTVFNSPFDLGLLGFAPPYGGGNPPAIWNTIGSFPILGQPTFNSAIAPATLFSHPGRANPLCVTFQGIVRDNEARIPEGFAVTNAVILKVQ